MPPRATYRVQFSDDFGFDHAAALAPYLAKLGISHLYASPYLKARPGSTHGYDIVDHGALNPELGDEAAFERMNAALRQNGLGQILDFVPNHMGVGGADNPFWLDVLEWGPDSAYAGWFDIDWSPDRADLRDKILVPFLGEQLGVAIEAGTFALKFDPDAGSFAVWAHDSHKLPIAPRHYGEIMGGGRADLERLGDDFANLAFWRPNERERAEALRRELAATVASQPEVARAIAVGMARFRGREGEASSWSALESLMRKQFWRPAHFRVAADDINYRRFFNIAGLAGLRMDLPSVFDHAHWLAFDLMARGIVDGLRIDHVDGLLDPKAYLERLREQAPRTDPESPFYLVVEKILGEGEPLRSDWPVDGTTGYEVANQLLGLMIDSESEAAFSRIYAAFTGQSAAFEDILRHSKKRIMDDEMASELAGLARAAGRIALENGRTADFTRNILQRAIREIVACFPVYRTYVDFEGVAAEGDRVIIAAAIADARTHDAAIDDSVYVFLESLLTGDLVAEPGSGFSRSAVLRFAMKLQQYSGPVMAKGLEDTAFYRYNRFVALNEVGGNPRRFGRSPAAFHAANAARAGQWPQAMLGTSTHDTKRGEDARARLAVVSELPEEWAAAVAAWSRCLRGETASADSTAAPDRNDEYALYQTLIGTAPPALLNAEHYDAEAWEAYAARVSTAMQKAMREAKLHTTWTAPDQAYEDAMAALITTALVGERADAFRALFLPFAAEVARLGVENSLLQTALKLTMPGVPDIYQGTELWDLSMVDPDNRRAIDFGARARILDEVQAAMATDPAGATETFLAKWQDGRIKMAVTAVLLDLRRDMPGLFSEGSYEPLPVEGPEADTVCAFARRHEHTTLVVIAARYPARRRRQPISAATRIAWPAGMAEWRDALAGTVILSDPTLSSITRARPIAVLIGRFPKSPEEPAG